MHTPLNNTYQNKNSVLGKVDLHSRLDAQLPDNQYDILMAQIKAFEDELDENEEIALQLASFGQSILMSVTDIEYHNPSLMIFHGNVNGQRSQLIQHVSQLSFLIKVVPKSNPDRPTRRIGFTSES